MITKLKIDHFKSWRSTGDIHFSKLTGFFGTNSSGKTSILQFLLLLKQTVESTDRSQVLDLGTQRSYVELGNFKDIIFNHQTDQTLQFEIAWNLEKDLEISTQEGENVTSHKDKNLSFKAAIRQDKGFAYADELSYIFGQTVFKMKKQKNEKDEYSLSAEPIGTQAPPFVFNRPVGRAWNLPAPVKCYGFPDQVKAYYTNAGFLADLQLKFEELFTGVYYLGPLREYPRRQYNWAGAKPADMGRRGELVIDALLGARLKGQKISRGQGRGKKRLTVEEYVAFWLKELELIHHFQVKEISKDSNLYQVLLKISETSPEVLITDVGFGLSQILPVIALCYYVPEGSTLIMEQPEIHLHPKVQAGLADVFIDAIEKRNIQIILESHSEHLLRRLQLRIAEEKFSSNSSALYFVENCNGESILNKLALNKDGQILNWPKDFFGDDLGELAAMSQAIYNRKKGK